LHLTLKMLTLLDEEEVEEAKKTVDAAITGCMSKILANKPLEAEIGGLDVMNDDPAHARVLYACVSSGRLVLFATFTVLHCSSWSLI
uniref:AKAP7_NLS domain-containing protein n=1 Tax=Gongylonema pulchrum TaxID=637853 RepID=A0A183DGN4_9BILA